MYQLQCYHHRRRLAAFPCLSAKDCKRPQTLSSCFHQVDVSKLAFKGAAQQKACI